MLLHTKPAAKQERMRMINDYGSQQTRQSVTELNQNVKGPGWKRYGKAELSVECGSVVINPLSALHSHFILYFEKDNV